VPPLNLDLSPDYCVESEITFDFSHFVNFFSTNCDIKIKKMFCLTFKFLHFHFKIKRKCLFVAKIAMGNFSNASRSHSGNNELIWQIFLHESIWQILHINEYWH
jgi:hypothetical protein